MLPYFSDIGLLVAIVYTIVETLEKFGMKRKHAHLLAIPLGIAVGIFAFEDEIFYRKVVYGIFVGILSVGSCDTACNLVDIFKKRE
jgi:Na+/serine symporter